MKAEFIARALGGRRVGAGWMACCPTHEDRTPSLSIAQGEHGAVLVHCHAGCAQGVVIAALRMRGLWRSGAQAGERPRAGEGVSARREGAPGAIDREAAAQAIWRAARPAKATLVETYLRSRGIGMAPPDQLRFAPRLKHPSGESWPTMVALVTSGDEGRPLGIHRTFLARDGSGKAPVAPQKMMLGACRGGAVRLGQAGPVLLVGEGIETCLSAMQAAGIPAWAALSTAGLRTLVLPVIVRELIVLADGDEAGERAARDCAYLWKREGRSARIARAPPGMDFNDMLNARAPKREGDAQ